MLFNRELLEYKMLFNIESLKKLIHLPDFSKLHNLSTEQIDLLKNAILKIKLEQCSTLSKYLEKLFFELPEQYRVSFIKKITLNSIEPKKLIAAFNVNQRCSDEFSNDPKYSAKILFWTIVHSYFLDKWLFTQNSNIVYPPLSILLLERKDTQSNISKYFVERFSKLTMEEQTLLNEVYSRKNLSRKPFLREAHDHIRLNLFELQSIIISFVEALNHHFAPPTNIIVKPMPYPSFYSHNFFLFTNSSLFHFIETENINALLSNLSLNGNNPNIIDYHTRLSLLSYAVQLQKLKMVQLLLLFNANVKLVDATRMTALHYAVEHPDPTILGLIIAAKPDLDAADLYGHAPLHLAADLGHIECVKTLLKEGADPNRQNSQQSTPLHLAVTKNQFSVVKLLLDTATINLQIKDQYGRRAQDLAVNQTMLELFLRQPGAHLFLKKAFKTHPNPYSNLAVMLMGPLEYKLRLTKLHEKYSKIENPFLSFENQVEKKLGTSVIKNFFDVMVKQQFREMEKHNQFLVIENQLKQLAALKINDSAKAYQKIIELAKTIDQGGISLLAFSFEVWRYGFLNQLINLYEQKSVMQIAIENEESETIVQLITADPNRLQKDYYFTKEDTGHHMTELEFAIYSGKPEAVKTLLETATRMPSVQLGNIPRNAVLLAVTKKDGSDATPAFKEAKEFLKIEVPRASRLNWRKLLQDLLMGLPPSETNPVHGLFAQPEYEIVKSLVGEKEQYQMSDAKKKWLFLIKKAKAHQFLTAELAALPDTEENKTHREFVIQALIFLDNKKINQIHQYKEEFAFLPSDKYPRNTFKHATRKGKEIEASGRLTTVDHLIEMLENEAIQIQVSTPIGSRKNSFFCAGGDKAALTQFRSNDSHIIEVNMTEARRSGLIGPADVYTSPHIPAYNIARVETPIVFIGENPRIKTVYRVFHAIRNTNNPTASLGEKGYKMHWFDYYLDDQLIDSYHYELEMRQEFFQGENIKAKAYRFIKILREIKGPFETGSFYHYLLKNRHNIAIIESAVATIFNVYNVEGKVSKDIDINHPAVKIIANESINQLTTYHPDNFEPLYTWIQEGNLTKLSQLTSLDINFIEGGSLVTAAVLYQQQEIVSFLLAKGAPAYSRTEKALRIALEKLNEAYLKPDGVESQSFQTALSICKLLLYTGSTSTLDPEHIHFSASPDNWGELEVKHAWSNKSKRDLWQIKVFLLSYREFSLHEMLLAGVTKQLDELYKFTFRYALLETHQYIAKRLNKNSLTASLSMEMLMQHIKDGSFSTLQPLSKEVTEFVFNYSIKLGKLALFKKLYPDYKQQNRAADESFNKKSNYVFSPLFTSLRFDQIEIFKLIFSEMDKTTEEYPFHRHLQHASSWNQTEVVQLLVANGIKLPDDEYLVSAIKKQAVNKFSLLVQAIDLAHFVGNQSTVKNGIKPLIEAIKLKEVKLFNQLLEAYKKAIDNAQFKAVLNECCVAASELDEPSFFIDLLGRYLKLAHGKSKISVLQQVFNSFAIESSLPCFDYFTQLIISKFNQNKNTIFQFSGHNKSPHLTFCKILLKNDANKLRQLSKLMPDSLTIPMDYWQSLLPNISLEMMSLIIELKIACNNHEEILTVLSFAIVNGRLDIVKWLFEKTISENYLTESGDNILHLIAKQYNTHEYALLPYKEINVQGMQGCIDYLCNDLNIDVNHKNNADDTLFLTIKSLSLVQKKYDTNRSLEIFLTRIASYPQTDLTLHNQGYSIIHTQIINPSIIDKYQRQGGHFGIKDNYIHTPIEAALVRYPNLPQEKTNQFKEIIASLQQYCEPPRKFINYHNEYLFLILFTLIVEDKTYLLLTNNRPFYPLFNSVIEENETRYYFKEAEGDQRRLTQILHIEKVEPSLSIGLKYVRKMVGNLHQVEAIELPSASSFERISDEIYKITSAPKPLFVNQFFKTLLELLNSPKEITDPQTKTADYQLTTIDFTNLLNEYQQLHSRLQTLYGAIAQGDNIQSVDCYSQAMSAGIPCSAHILKSKGYELVRYDSALDAALVLSKVNILNQLFMHAVDIKQEKVVPDWALAKAIKYQDKLILSALMQYKVKAKSIWNCLELLLPNSEMLHACFLHLKNIDPAPALANKIKLRIEKFNREFNIKEPIYNEIFELLKDMERTRSSSKAHTCKQKSSSTTSMSDKRKRASTSTTQKSATKKIKLEEQTSNNLPELGKPTLPSFSQSVQMLNSPVFSGTKRESEPFVNPNLQKLEQKNKKLRRN
jgi:ankyrin repeat protein